MLKILNIGPIAFKFTTSFTLKSNLLIESLYNRSPKLEAFCTQMECFAKTTSFTVSSRIIKYKNYIK